MRQSKFHRDIPNDAKIVMKTPDKSMYVVVLNDGETYTGLTGSKILTIPEDIDENDVDTYVKENYLTGTDIVVPDTDKNA